MSRTIEFSELRQGQTVRIGYKVEDVSLTSEGVVQEARLTSRYVWLGLKGSSCISRDFVTSITLLSEPEPPEGSVAVKPGGTLAAVRKPLGWSLDGAHVTAPNPWRHLTDEGFVVLRHGYGKDKP